MIRKVAPAPPQSDESEKGVLGSILAEKGKPLSECVSQISPEYFFNPVHREIYESLIEMWDNNKPIDLITFTQYLRDKGTLQKLGGAAYVTELFTFIPTAANIRYYIETVRDKYILREIISTGTDCVKKAYQEQDEVDALLENTQNRFLKLSEPMGSSEKSIEVYAQEALLDIANSHEHRGQVPGLSSGLVDLDKVLGGMRGKQFIVIAGETGEGKTALALKFAESLAIKDEIPVGILSLEMGGEELCNRWIASLAKVDLHEFFTTGGDEKDLNRIMSASHKLKESKVHIRDESDITPLQMRAIARQLKHQYGIKMLIVDYIQLMAMSGDSREQQVAQAAQAMKNCAKELNIVVVGLSQVNDDGRVRDSRAIGFHADKVLFLNHTKDGSWINVKKNRSGPKGSVPVAFLRQYATFENAAKMSQT